MRVSQAKTAMYHPLVVEELELQFNQGFDEGKAKSRLREKEKARQSERGEDLERVQREKEELLLSVSAYQMRVDELEEENGLLQAKIASLESNSRSFPPLPSKGKSSMPTPMEVDDNDGMVYHSYSGATQSSRITGPPVRPPASGISPASGPSSASKRKLTNEEYEAKNARARLARTTIRDGKTGLPCPVLPGGNSHIAGGPWDKMLNLYQGTDVYHRVRKAALHRYRPEWKDAIKEIRELLNASPEALGKAQSLALRLHKLPMTILEEAMNNRQSAPGGIRWESNGSPNTNDLRTWQFIRTIIGRSKSTQRGMTRQALYDVILDDNIWNTHAPLNVPQSSGLVDQPFPQDTNPGHLEMVNHLVSCGVTMADIHGSLRPWIQRCMPTPPPPSQVVPPVTTTLVPTPITTQTVVSSPISVISVPSIRSQASKRASPVPSSNQPADSPMGDAPSMQVSPRDGTSPPQG
jgi:hypothetical protein